MVVECMPRAECMVTMSALWHTILRVLHHIRLYHAFGLFLSLLLLFPSHVLSKLMPTKRSLRDESLSTFLTDKFLMKYILDHLQSAFRWQSAIRDGRRHQLTPHKVPPLKLLLTRLDVIAWRAI